MKADHRKELQTNWLADSLGHALQQAKEGPSQKVLLYGGLALVVAVLIGVFIWFSTHSKDTDSLLWEQFNQVTQETNPDVPTDELAKLSKEYQGKPAEWQKRLYVLNKFEAEHPKTKQARMAQFFKARLLMESTEGLASPLLHDTTLKCIKEGRDLYEELVAVSGDEASLAAEALFNSAKANEDLGDFERARKNYERLQKEYPKSLYGSAAEKALARLNGEQDDLDKLKKLVEAKAD